MDKDRNMSSAYIIQEPKTYFYYNKLTYVVKCLPWDYKSLPHNVQGLWVQSKIWFDIYVLSVFI